MKIDRTVRVELTHEDIEQAIRDYIAEQVPGISDFKLDIFNGNEVPAGDSYGRTPYCNLYAAAEIELAPQPVMRGIPALMSPLVGAEVDKLDKLDQTRRVR